MSRKYKLNEKGYCNVAFEKPARTKLKDTPSSPPKDLPKESKRVVFTSKKKSIPKEDIPSEKSESNEEYYEGDNLGDNSDDNSDNNSDDNTDDNSDDNSDNNLEIETLDHDVVNEETNVVIEEDCGEEDVHYPNMFYGKLRTLNSEIKEEDFDEGYDANNICHHITLPSFPSPTIAQLKMEFLKVMGKEAQLKNVLIYRLHYPKVGEDVDDSEIVLPDGRRGQLLEQNSKTVADFNITNGDFFEIEIREKSSVQKTLNF